MYIRDRGLLSRSLTSSCYHLLYHMSNQEWLLAQELSEIGKIFLKQKDNFPPSKLSIHVTSDLGLINPFLEIGILT